MNEIKTILDASNCEDTKLTPKSRQRLLHLLSLQHIPLKLPNKGRLHSLIHFVMEINIHTDHVFNSNLNFLHGGLEDLLI